MIQNKKYTVLFFLFLLICKVSFATQNIYGLDNFKFNFKLYLNSIIDNKNENDKTIDFRKSKLGFIYDINEKLSFNSSFLYSKRNDFEFDTEYFDYKINEKSAVSIGNISTVFDMYVNKSENHLSILAPTTIGATAIFVKSKGLGFSYRTIYNDNFGFHTSLVGKNINNSDDNSKMFSFRNYYFIENYNNLLHIGLNGNIIQNKSNKTKIKHINNIYQKFPLDKSASIGLELAEKLNNFTIESGIFYTKINPMVETLKHKYFDTYNIYYEMNYILTGENKYYSSLDGVIKGMKVKKPINESGIGAIELVGRYQFIDMISKGKIYTIDMGKHNVFITGINWLPTNNCKILFNYINTNSKYKSLKTLKNNEFKFEYRLFI